MNTVVEIVALLRKQSELESQLLDSHRAVGAEQELEVTRRRLATHTPNRSMPCRRPARALRRTPDTISVEDVKDFGGAI
jgi:hypothetical protein